MIHFDVMTGRGLGHNAMLSGDRKAAERQSLNEHESLLDITTLPDYAKVMAMPPGPARAAAMQMLQAQAELREQEYPRYWNDTVPRRNISQSSSFIGPIDYDQNTNLAAVQMGDKVYMYPNLDPVRMSEWLNSPSMEDYFRNYIKGK